MGVRDRLIHAWNAFLNVRPDLRSYDGGVSYSRRPDRTRVMISNERSIISSIYTRIAVDVADPIIRHVRLDDQERYIEDVESGLNDCLKADPNIDQGPRQFRQDIAMTLFAQGVAVIVPVDTTVNPVVSGGFDIKSMRVGNVVAWMPQHIRVSLYNEQTGRREEVTLEKKFVAIVENPLYAVMNEPNSTLQRLIRTLGLLDNLDETRASNKLDIILQLPYTVKSDTRKKQAEQRTKDIEFQLKQSDYGIAYADATEKVVQLNRSVENNLQPRVEYLVNLLYTQLGLTPEVMNGTADEKAMLNYANRTIEPILDAIVEAMRKAFLTKTARTQKQSIMYFRDPFKLVPISDIAEIADKLTRNEIVSSNEFRQVLRFKPSKDPKADQLRNSNMPQSELGTDEPARKKEDIPPTSIPLDQQRSKTALNGR